MQESDAAVAQLDSKSSPSWTPGRPAATCRRRRVLGVDLWAERPSGADQMLVEARSGANDTYFRLVAALEAEDSDGSAWESVRKEMRLRFVARQDDVHVTDEAICELLSRLSGKLRWSRLAKLEEFDGIPAFIPLPTL